LGVIKKVLRGRFPARRFDQLVVHPSFGSTIHALVDFYSVFVFPSPQFYPT
jgi:hypothetical protein